MADDPLTGWGLRPVELADRPLLDSYFATLAHPLSDYTFSQLFTWSNSLKILWKQIAGHLCVFANGAGDLTLLVPPIGDTGADRALAECFELMDAYNAAKRRPAPHPRRVRQRRTGRPHRPLARPARADGLRLRLRDRQDDRPARRRPGQQAAGEEPVHAPLRAPRRALLRGRAPRRVPPAARAVEDPPGHARRDRQLHQRGQAAEGSQGDGPLPGSGRGDRPEGDGRLGRRARRAGPSAASRSASRSAATRAASPSRRPT